MISGPLGRVRVFAGYLGLLGVLGLLAGLLVTGTPRVANGLADLGLGQDIAALPSPVRDLAYSFTPQTDADVIAPAQAAALLDTYRDMLRDPLPALIDDQWSAIQIGPDPVATSADFTPFNGLIKHQLGLRTQDGAEAATTLLAGRWPTSTTEAQAEGVVEVVAAKAVADTLGLRLDSVLSLAIGARAVEVRVVGLFAAVDAEAPYWDNMALALTPTVPLLDGEKYRAVLLTDPAGLAEAGRRIGSLRYEWRYRLDEERLTTTEVEPLLTAVAWARRTPPNLKYSLSTGLDSALLTIAEQLHAVQALLAVVQAGTLATLLGLITLAARLMVRRRHEEFTLLRARGGATTTIGRRTLAEALIVLPGAVLVGWLLGQLLPGRPADTGWLLLGMASVTTLAVPVLAMAGQRRISFIGQRQDLVRHRPSARRLTAEALVLLLAGLGVLLLHRRGLSQRSEVDPYLVSVPVLLATGTALITLRIFPWPLRQVGRLTARARGAVAFIGLARAGRGAPLTVGPLAVLVVAISTGVFSGAVANTIAQARDRATDQEIAADARLTGYAFAPETAQRLAQLPGVDAVSPVAARSGGALRSGTESTSRSLGQAQILVLDAPSLARVIERSGVGVRLPAAFANATPTSGPVPAVVSPEVAAEIGAGAVAEVQGRRYEFTVSAVSSGFPGVSVGTRRFVALPWQALPVPEAMPLIPDRFLIAGHDLDPAALRTTGDAGQRAQIGSVLGHPVSTVPRPATVQTWTEHRQGLERTGANQVLSFTFATGAVGATVLALLAIGFTVLAEAPGRGRMLSRLRTLGLSSRQSRGLLMYELGPLVGIAALAGGLVGAALPRLLAPSLGLATFTAGVPPRIHLDPLLAGGVLLLVLATLITALGVESAFNRRTRLGEALRLGEGN